MKGSREQNRNCELQQAFAHNFLQTVLLGEALRANRWHMPKTWAKPGEKPVESWALAV